MELGEFVKSILLDVESALTEVSGSKDKHYHITPDGGISFDIAVTVSDTIKNTVDGKIGAGIKVFGANVEGKKETGKESNEISRVKFVVYVPSKTETQFKSEMNAATEANRNNFESHYS